MITSVFFCLIIYALALSGNGTLNKQAGIDYKQLSLLAKINENQSGEVSCSLFIALSAQLLTRLSALSVCSYGRVGGRGMRL